MGGYKSTILTLIIPDKEYKSLKANSKSLDEIFKKATKSKDKKITVTTGLIGGR